MSATEQPIVGARKITGAVSTAKQAGLRSSSDTLAGGQFRGVIVTDRSRKQAVVAFSDRADAVNQVLRQDGTFGKVTAAAVAASGGKLVPWTSGSLDEPELVFDGRGNVVMAWELDE